MAPRRARQLFVLLSASLAATASDVRGGDTTRAVRSARPMRAVTTRAGTVRLTGADSAVAVQLRALADGRRHPFMRWNRLDDVAADLRAAYDGVGWTLLWSRDGRASPAALALLDQIAASDTRGLNPDDYDAATLQRLADPRSAPSLATPVQRADFDVALSAASARLVRALRFGRISPTAAHAELHFTAAPDAPAFDVAATVRALAATTASGPLLDTLEPPYRHYRLLRTALRRYQTLARDSTLLPLALTMPLRAGARDRGVPRLRRLLVALGDLPDSAATRADADSTVYQGALVDAVRRFQARHGAEPNGVIAAATAANLSRPFAAHADQMALTLERWRWLPHVFAAPPVIVNVPTFRLHAFASSSDREADVLSMDVVVGDAYRRQTPVFSGTMRYLGFAPYWDVPPSIARAELLPRARRDPEYLARDHYEVVDGADHVLGASRAALDLVAVGRARIRQRPGPTNALGGVKFIFPNAHNVYLHDSPARAAFARARRDVSHGCVRLSDAAHLARFLLREQPGWDSAHVAAAMRQDRPQQVTLTRPVPVDIVYATAIAREDGRVQFADDLYGHDRALARLLARGYPYPREPAAGHDVATQPR